MCTYVQNSETRLPCRRRRRRMEEAQTYTRRRVCLTYDIGGTRRRRTHLHMEEALGGGCVSPTNPYIYESIYLGTHLCIYIWRRHEEEEDASTYGGGPRRRVCLTYEPIYLRIYTSRHSPTHLYMEEAIGGEAQTYESIYLALYIYIYIYSNVC